MSRYTKHLDGNRFVAYGHDHAIGYFFQVFEEDDEDGEEALSVDESTVLTHMSNADMIKLMKEHKVDEERIKYVVLDLPF